MSPLGFLRATAAQNHAVLLDGDDETARFSVQPPLPSGAPSPEYKLVIKTIGQSVTAAEIDPTLLPEFCPERHINPGGTFCLYWAEAEDGDIVDEDTANLWWGKLLLFLRHQRTAGKLREWPGQGDARAHGNAARYQAQAEQEADVLGQTLRQALRDNRLTTKKRKSGRIGLYLNGKRLLSVFLKERRVMTLRQRCKCAEAEQRRLPIVDCGDHGAAIVRLVLAMEAWKSAEAEFSKTFKSLSYKCCGTMDNCPLAASLTDPVKEAA